MAAVPSPAGAADRVVSLNLCTDQMLVLLAPEKVAALTPLARDPTLSFVAPRAMHLPVVRTSAEAILRLHPDLILATAFGAQTTLGILRQEGLRIVQVDLPQTFEAIRHQTRRLGALLGYPERAAALIAAMDATLAALPQARRARTAVALEPRLLTAGPGTLMDSVLHAAGLTNIATGRPVSLELLLRHPPDLLVLPAEAAFPSLATDGLHTGALARLPHRTIPSALTLCAGPFTAQVAARLAR